MVIAARMPRRRPQLPVLGALALLALAVSANQLEDIPHNEVKNWALKFGVDLWEFGRHFTKMNQIQNKYKEYNVEVVRKDGLLLVRDLAAEVKNHMDFKINAVMRIMDSAEAAAQSSVSHSDGRQGSYYDARWLNVHADDGTLAARARRLQLAPSRHFDHIAVNTSYSAVLMPPYINVEDFEVQNQISWSEHLDPLFVNNYEIDPTLSWQYFASSSGFMRRYPAMSWPPEDGYSHHARDFYDFRSSNWFVEAATSPKDLVILIDDSDDLGSRHWRLARATASALLDTLGPNDFVNVYRYSDTVAEINECHAKILAQALPESIRELKSSLWGAELTGGTANLTAALTAAFEILHRYNRTGQGCQCNQAIAVIGAGGGESGVKSVFRTWNWPHMPVRIFTYQVGGDASMGENLKSMACGNKGFHVSINDHSEIRPKVLHFVEVLARPLVMYQNVHPVHWSPAYVGGRSNSLADDGMGQLMSSVTVPIFDRRNHTHREANLLGVVGTDVPVDQIKKLVPPYRLGVNGYSFMVDNNGHVLYHPDLRPLHTNEEYTETLRPLYSNVDITDLELLMDADESSKVNLTSLLLDLRHDMIEQREGETEIGVKVQYENMKRVSTRRQRYFYSPVDGTPYSLAVVLPDGYGMYELQAEQEVKHSNNNVTEYFKGDTWKLHPDWVYCEYASTSDQTFNSPEEQMLHFLTRAGKPGWKWMSLRPRALAQHNSHKKQDRDAYYCDKTLVQSLIRDAMVIKELEAHSGHASHHSQQGRFHKFVVTLSFIATRSGLLKWTENNSTKSSESSESHFSEKYVRAFDSEWYRRAVEHHSIEPESFVFSVPFREGEEEFTGKPPLIQATHAVFVENRGHRAPVAVVGLHFQLDSLTKHFLNVTSTCTPGQPCKKSCAGEELDCYILDDNGFIILSEEASQTGMFFGQVDGTIMDSLVQDRIYKKIIVQDHQGRCPDARNPFSGNSNILQPLKPLSWLGGYLWNLAAVWFPLWDNVKARSHPDYESDVSLISEQHIDGVDLCWLVFGYFFSVSALYKKIGPKISKALPALHAFTGCDFNPALYRRGKKKPLQFLMNSEIFQNAFLDLGSKEHNVQDSFNTMQSFTCHLYGLKKLDEVNQARIAIFYKTYRVKDTSQPFSLSIRNHNACNLPPCQSELRTRFIACLWSNAHNAKITDLLPTDYGWKVVDGKFEMIWFAGDQLPKAYEDVVITPDILEDTPESDYTDYEEEPESESEENSSGGTYQIIIEGGVAPPPPPPAPPQWPPPRSSPRSAALRPCDTSAELYALQSQRLNAAQPLKGKLTNCHNSGCERPFSVQKIPHSNLILLVVDTLCPCGTKRIDVRQREYTQRTVCRRHSLHGHRRKPHSCVSYHPEEIEIQSCGRAECLRPLHAVLVTIITWLAVSIAT